MRTLTALSIFLLSLSLFGQHSSVDSFTQIPATDILTCQNILSKKIILKEEFKQLDNLLFEMNYYASGTPLELYKAASAKAKELGNYEYVVQFEIWIANLYDQLYQPDSSRYHANYAANFAQQHGDELTYAKTANIRRLALSRQNKFTEALEVCYEALEIFDQHQDEIGKAITYRDIGTIKIHEKKFDEALEFCLKSVAGLKGTDQLYELVFSYQRCALVYTKLGDTEQAVNFMNKGIDTARQLNEFRKKQMLSKCYFTLSVIHKGNKDFTSALGYLDSMKVIDSSYGTYLHYRTIHHQKGSIFLEQKKYKKALEEFNIALDYVQKYNLQQNTYDHFIPIYSNLVKTHEGLGNYQKANQYLNQITLAKDSIFAVEKEKQKIELQTKYETAQKETTILNLKKEKLVQRSYLLLSGGLLFILGLLAFFLFRNNRYRAHTNKKLAEQKKLIEDKNTQNELLLKEIHHRVKNNLQTISSLLNLQSSSINDPNALEAVQESQNRVASMALIHQKLYQGENLAAIDMRDYFETIGNSIIGSFNGMSNTVSLQVDMPKIELDVDTAIPIGLITNELITNSMKYAFQEKENGKIFISMTKNENNLIQLQIKDDGINNSAGVSEGGTGFGTMLVQLLTTQLGGQIEQTTTQGTATIIKFSLDNKAA